MKLNRPLRACRVLFSAVNWAGVLSSSSSVTRMTLFAGVADALGAAAVGRQAAEGATDAVEVGEVVTVWIRVSLPPKRSSA